LVIGILLFGTSRSRDNCSIIESHFPYITFREDCHSVVVHNDERAAAAATHYYIAEMEPSMRRRRRRRQRRQPEKRFLVAALVLFSATRCPTDAFAPSSLSTTPNANRRPRRFSPSRSVNPYRDGVNSRPSLPLDDPSQRRTRSGTSSSSLGMLGGAAAAAASPAALTAAAAAITGAVTGGLFAGGLHAIAGEFCFVFCFRDVAGGVFLYIVMMVKPWEQLPYVMS